MSAEGHNHHSPPAKPPSTDFYQTEHSGVDFSRESCSITSASDLKSEGTQVLLETKAELEAAHILGNLLDGLGSTSQKQSPKPLPLSVAPISAPPVKVDDDKPHKCPTCGRGFRLKFNRDRHENTHSGNRDFPCTLCNKKFRDQNQLNAHERSLHSAEKPHVCKFCGRCFRKPASLRNHTYQHTGDWPHKCDLCGKGFIQPYRLRDHQHQHTGSKAFECNLCGGMFATGQNLKNHHKNMPNCSSS